LSTAASSTAITTSSSGCCGDRRFTPHEPPHPFRPSLAIRVHLNLGSSDLAAATALGVPDGPSTPSSSPSLRKSRILRLLVVASEPIGGRAGCRHRTEDAF
jgi:hypothetical protein